MFDWLFSLFGYEKKKNKVKSITTEYNVSTTETERTDGVPTLPPADTWNSSGSTEWHYNKNDELMKIVFKPRN